MSKRLQIIMPDDEMADLRRIAKRQGMTVREWVRRTLLEARQQQPRITVARKLSALRKASQYSFQTAGIHQMLAEIGKGSQR